MCLSLNIYATNETACWHSGFTHPFKLMSFCVCEITKSSLSSQDKASSENRIDGSAAGISPQD